LALGVLEIMMSNGCLPDIDNYNFVLCALCRKGQVEQALKIFHKLDDVGCHPDVRSYNNIICGLWNMGDRSRAIKMVEEMVSAGIDPDDITYSSILCSLCRGRMVDEAMSYLRTWRTIESNQM